MKILLVEDDEFKAKDISELILSEFSGYQIFHVADVASAILEIKDQDYELIILDIALPSRAMKAGAGSTQSLLSGGVEIIYRLEVETHSCPVLIVTQYPDIEVEGEIVSTNVLGRNPRKYFDADIIGCVRYDRKDKSTWKQELVKAAKKVL